MEILELPKPNNQFAKGASRFDITVNIKASDVKKFGIPYSFVGKDITLKPAEWSKYSGKSKDAISKAMANEEKDRKKGMPHRDLRMIIGFVRYDKRNVTRFDEPKLPVDVQAAMDFWNYGRAR